MGDWPSDYIEQTEYTNSLLYFSPVRFSGGQARDAAARHRMGSEWRFTVMLLELLRQTPFSSDPTESVYNRVVWRLCELWASKFKNGSPPL